MSLTHDQRDRLEQVAAGNGAGPAASFALTDLGNAERLAAMHGEDLRHVAGLGWHVWDGRCWRRDDTGELQRRAKLTARAILHDAANCDDDAERKTVVKWARTSEAEPRLRAAVTVAASEKPLVARTGDLDRDPHLLNVANGTVDLRTGELRPFARGDLLTLISAHSYDPQATCPRFEQFLGEVFDGDEELITFMHAFIGYTLTGLTREEVLTVFHGSGCNGKSTLLAVMKALLGEYAVTASFDTFMRARGDRGPRNDLARLHRARLVTAAESGEGKSLDEATVKEITGGDTIAARFLYAEHFEYTPQFKLLLVSNHRPKVDGTDDALWRRLRLVPFNESFEGREDRELAEKLDAEMPGILTWAVQGCLKWQREGLGEPAAVTEATSEYRQDEDLLGAFLEEKCSRSGEIEPAKLRAAYEQYCHEIGEQPLTASVLGKQLAKQGITKNKRAGVYQGVSLQ